MSIDDPQIALQGAADAGVVRFPNDPDRLTIVAKTTHALSSGELKDPIPLAHEVPDASDEDGRRLEAPSDWVPSKASVDVLVVGHARCEPAQRGWPVAIQIDAFEQEAFIECERPMSECRLVSPFLRQREGDDAPETRWAPARPEDDSHQYASPALRLDELPLGKRLILRGLVGGGAAKNVRLPARAPALFRLDARGREQALALRADTLWIHTDRGVMTITWRAVGPALGEGESLVLVADGNPSWDEARYRLPRADWRPLRDGSAAEDEAPASESTSSARGPASSSPSSQGPSSHGASDLTETQALDGSSTVYLEDAHPFRDAAPASKSLPFRERPASSDHLPFQLNDPSDGAAEVDAPQSMSSPRPADWSTGTQAIEPDESRESPVPAPPAATATSAAPLSAAPSSAAPSSAPASEPPQNPTGFVQWTLDKDGLLPLAAYADIKVRLLAGDEPSEEILTRNGLASTDWQEQEKRRASALRDASQRGDGTFVRDLRQAMVGAAARMQLDEVDEASLTETVV